jgi:hypothetical protein
MSEILTAPEESSGDDIRTKADLIWYINRLQTELFNKPVDAYMFDYLIELSEGSLSGIIMTLLLIRRIRREEDTP